MTSNIIIINSLNIIPQIEYKTWVTKSTFYKLIISKTHLLHIGTPQETLASDKKRVSQHLIKNYQAFPTTN